MKSDQDSCSVPGFDVGLEALLAQWGEILSEFFYAQDIVLHVQRWLNLRKFLLWLQSKKRIPNHRFEQYRLIQKMLRTAQDSDLALFLGRFEPK